MSPTITQSRWLGAASPGTFRFPVKRISRRTWTVALTRIVGRAFTPSGYG